MSDHLVCPKCRQFDVGDESCDVCGTPLVPILALSDLQGILDESVFDDPEWVAADNERFQRKKTAGEQTEWARPWVR